MYLRQKVKGTAALKGDVFQMLVMQHHQILSTCTCIKDILPTELKVSLISVSVSISVSIVVG